MIFAGSARAGGLASEFAHQLRTWVPDNAGPHPKQVLRLQDDLAPEEHWLEVRKGWYKHDAAEDWLWKPKDCIYYHCTADSLLAAANPI